MAQPPSYSSDPKVRKVPMVLVVDSSILPQVVFTHSKKLRIVIMTINLEIKSLLQVSVKVWSSSPVLSRLEVSKMSQT